MPFFRKNRKKRVAGAFSVETTSVLCYNGKNTKKRVRKWQTKPIILLCLTPV